MRNCLVLSIASLVLAFASGCSHETSGRAGTADNDDAEAKQTGSSDNAATTNKSGAAATANATPSDPATTTVVHGKLAEKSVALDNARALAITSDQTTYWSSLDADGEFTLTLPIGAAYRIVFVNQLAGGGQVKIGNLSFKSDTDVSAWFGANVSGDVDFGDVSASGGAGSSAADHTDDPSCQSDANRTADGAKDSDSQSVQLGAINVCLIWPSVQLYPGVDIDAKYAAQDPSASDTQEDDDKSCAYWSGAAGGLTWGAPWSFAASGEVALAGGFTVESSLSCGFGGGLYGGFYSSADGSFTLDSSFSSSLSGGFSESFSSSFGSSMTGSISSSFSFDESFSSNVEVVGVFGGVQISEGWAIGGSISVESDVCVTASTCASTSSCVASKCAANGN